MQLLCKSLCITTMKINFSNYKKDNTKEDPSNSLKKERAAIH